MQRSPVYRGEEWVCLNLFRIVRVDVVGVGGQMVACIVVVDAVGGGSEAGFFLAYEGVDEGFGLVG